MDEKITEVCLDNNIIVTYLSPDETCVAVNELVMSILKTKKMIRVPALINYEFANAIGRKTRNQLLTEIQKNTALDEFFELPILLMWNQATMKRTLEFTHRGFAPLYDAAYLAVAMERGIPLITQDKEFLKKAKKEYPAVFTPEQWA